MSERSYLDTLRHVLTRGHRVPTRATLKSTGEPVDALSVFAPHAMRFDLRAGFPLLTTKHVSLRSVAAELLWFLSGSTNERDLAAMGSNIWRPWADAEGNVGPSYGYNWRAFGASVTDAGVDQIAEIVAGIRAVKANPRDDRARRLVLTALDPATVDESALYPCHVLVQWHVGRGTLSCHLYQRSADLFIGSPYNIASYALLTHLMARATGLCPGKLVVSMGDAHIYTNHLEQVREQLTRGPYLPPSLVLPEMRFEVPSWGALPQFAWPDGSPVTPDTLAAAMRDYKHHPALPGEVAV